MRIESEAELAEYLKRNPELTVSGEDKRLSRGAHNAEVVGSTPAPARPHKYRAQPTEYNGRRYASKKEAEFAQQLDLRQKAGEVEFWLRQVPFDLPGGSRYFLDFMVFIHRVKTLRWEVEFVEVKGRDLPMGRLKRRQVEEIFGVKVTVV